MEDRCLMMQPETSDFIFTANLFGFKRQRERRGEGRPKRRGPCLDEERLGEKWEP